MQRTSNTETGAVDDRTGTATHTQLRETCIVPDAAAHVHPSFTDASIRGTPGPVLITQRVCSNLLVSIQYHLCSCHCSKSALRGASRGTTDKNLSVGILTLTTRTNLENDITIFLQYRRRGLITLCTFLRKRNMAAIGDFKFFSKKT